MAQYDLGGGGTLITTPMDPLEVAMKRAQLEDLMQRPQIERDRLQLEREAGQRAYQQLMQTGEIERSRLGEEQRYHTGQLAESAADRNARVASEQQRLAEETRYHTGTLDEQKAGREAEIADRAAARKANVLGDVMTHLLPAEGTEGVPRNATSEIATQLGYPEIGRGLAAATSNALTARAKGLVPEYTKYTPEQRTKALGELPEDLRSALTPMLPTDQPATTAAPATTMRAGFGGGAPGINMGPLLKYAPVDLANYGVAGANTVGIPAINTLNSLFGVAPIPAQKPFPYDYSKIAKGQY